MLFERRYFDVDGGVVCLLIFVGVSLEGLGFEVRGWVDGKGLILLEYV